MRSRDARKHAILVLLDLSAMFNTIDHDLLSEFDRICVRSNALRWRPPDLTDRTQCVSVDGHLSSNVQLRHAVQQAVCWVLASFLCIVQVFRKFSELLCYVKVSLASRYLLLTRRRQRQYCSSTEQRCYTATSSFRRHLHRHHFNRHTRP